MFKEMEWVKSLQSSGTQVLQHILWKKCFQSRPVQVLISGGTDYRKNAGKGSAKWNLVCWPPSDCTVVNVLSNTVWVGSRDQEGRQWTSRIILMQNKYISNFWKWGNFFNSLYHKLFCFFYVSSCLFSLMDTQCRFYWPTWRTKCISLHMSKLQFHFIKCDTL